jgi:hypothetical protein
MSQSIFSSILVFSLLVGCASNQPLVISADNPASPEARESITPAAREVLGIDRASKRTRELIAARAVQDTQSRRQQKDQQIQNMPGMKNMPGMEHKEDSSSQKEGEHVRQ